MKNKYQKDGQETMPTIQQQQQAATTTTMSNNNSATTTITTTTSAIAFVGIRHYLFIFSI